MGQLISIIIPLYNKEKSIVRTINSVLTQSYINFELIIINDGSTDDSIKKVNDIKDERIRVINQENKGISGARNAGVQHSSGDWVLFLDADDIILPDGLANLVSAIEEKVDVVAGNFMIRVGNKAHRYLLNSKETIYPEGKAIRQFVLGRLFLRAGSFIISTSYAKRHLFDDNLSRYEDMKYILDLLNDNKLKYINKCVMCYETNFASASKIDDNKWNRDYGFHLSFEGHDFWGKCLLGDILNKTIFSYPSHAQKLKEKHKNDIIYAYVANVFAIVKIINRHLSKLL